MCWTNRISQRLQWIQAFHHRTPVLYPSCADHFIALCWLFPPAFGKSSFSEASEPDGVLVALPASVHQQWESASYLREQVEAGTSSGFLHTWVREECGGGDSEYQKARVSSRLLKKHSAKAVESLMLSVIHGRSLMQPHIIKRMAPPRGQKMDWKHTCLHKQQIFTSKLISRIMYRQNVAVW